MAITVACDGHPAWQAETASPPPTMESLLAQTLLHLGPDPVYTQALERAVPAP